ncbi:sensor histidine kinase [Enterococcus sp. BWB1-3]|uniref:two-component system sensor histidine kinase SapS n=1 Tax=unclassified Enterococcus TaxID=2608891 RepID=UPI001924C97F|nr:MULTISPECIES: sensor histidine kinase [unclassified Enterococcus]MBL1227731.1 sensor histidine kinase [Enterococcus sp. BWB1-3]MCB5952082.1 sensor histidine kinase [Enterococcus sp. BWT-B8]
MTFWKYLKDQRIVLFGWFFLIGLTCLVVWLSPDTRLSFSTISYLIILELLCLIALLVTDFLLKRRWWQKLDLSKQPAPLEEYLKGAAKTEEILTQEYVNSLLNEHQKVMEKIIDNQQEHKEYIDSWVHEIKVPLAALKLLLDSAEDDLSEDIYSLAENELAKMDEYVEQVLYYSRLDSFSKDYLIQEYSLKQVVQSVIKSQAYSFIQKNLRFSLEGEDQKVLTDGKWLEFIFRQLISNAVKYTPSRGKITVVFSRNKEGISLELKDSGIGIPAKDINRIFDKGFTGENGRQSAQHSTGLGLYLAKQLADKLGLELSAESVEQEGTTMLLFFPFINYYNEIR